MDKAYDQAREATRRVMAVQPTPQTRKTPDAGPSASVRKRKTNASPSNHDGTWWSTLGFKDKELALDHAYKTDLEKKSKMTAKCFSSRLYGRLKSLDVDLARQAHRDADEYMRSLEP